MINLSAVSPCAHSNPALPAPSIPWSERPKLTREERRRVNAARNAALYDAEHDPGVDGCGLTTAEVSAWVRRAEADAIASVMDDRDRAEVESCPTIEDVVTIGPVAEAEWSGFELGCNGMAVVGPAHYTPEERAAFLRGHAAGFKAYEEAEMAEWATGDDWPESQRVEAVGVIAVRRLA